MSLADINRQFTKEVADMNINSGAILQILAIFAITAIIFTIYLKMAGITFKEFCEEVFGEVKDVWSWSKK